MGSMLRERFLDVGGMFAEPVVVGLCVGVVGLLAVTPLVYWGLEKAGVSKGKLKQDLWDRWKSWLVLAPMMLVPVLLGDGTTILAVAALSLACHREYARATGLFREHLVSGAVVVGILFLAFAALDNWYGFFVALWALTVGLIVVMGIVTDRPAGFIQRVGLGVLGFMLFGVCLGHLGFVANERHYRSILFWIVLCVEMNDIFAYICGKSFGRRKLAVNTSPNKTVGGSVGAIVLTTGLAVGVGRFVFAGSALGAWHHLVLMGLMMSTLGQLGDLLLSSIKRDIGIKDMGNTFPGHGGLLDRFNSLLLVAPAMFHYIGYHQGIGLARPVHLILGE